MTVLESPQWSHYICSIQVTCWVLTWTWWLREHGGNVHSKSEALSRCITWEHFKDSIRGGYINSWVREGSDLSRQLITDQCIQVKRIQTEFGSVPLSDTPKRDGWIWGGLNLICSEEIGKWLKKKHSGKVFGSKNELFGKALWDMIHERKKSVFCNTLPILCLLIILETMGTKQWMSRFHLVN